MKAFFALFLLASLFACKNPTNDSTQVEDVAGLKSEIEQLRLDNELKDSMINESLTFFNEIQDNLESIGIKRERIQTMSENPEVDTYKKEWILQEIKHINYLREENSRKLGQLQEQLKASGLKLAQLENMIERLQQDVAMKDEQILRLKEDLQRKDVEYTKLFDAYQQKQFDLDMTVEDLNAAYYVYGTEKELVANGVIEKKNGFIGIGKKIMMKNDFNQSYFTKMDLRVKKDFVIANEKARIISIHPTAAYKLERNGKTNRLIIFDPEDFWKVSRYLIIVVD